MKLGMSLYDSMIVAECTEEEITQLNADQQFLKKVELHQRLEERALLEKFNTAIEANLKYGNTKALEKKLAKLNPDRWDDKKKEPEADPAALLASRVTIYLKGVFPRAE